jgi:hypothetical protein
MLDSNDLIMAFTRCWKLGKACVRIADKGGLCS